MTDEKQIAGKKASGSDEATHPEHMGGNPVRNARTWGGGSKASKGPIAPEDKRNPNSSAKT
jgi:hypothetical protein